MSDSVKITVLLCFSAIAGIAIFVGGVIYSTARSNERPDPPFPVSRPSLYCPYKCPYCHPSQGSLPTGETGSLSTGSKVQSK